MGRTGDVLLCLAANKIIHRRRIDRALPTVPRELQGSTPGRVFRDRTPKERLRQNTQKDPARSFLDQSTTGRRLMNTRTGRNGAGKTGNNNKIKERTEHAKTTTSYKRRI